MTQQTTDAVTHLLSHCLFKCSSTYVIVWVKVDVVSNSQLWLHTVVIHNEFFVGVMMVLWRSSRSLRSSVLGADLLATRICWILTSYTNRLFLCWWSVFFEEEQVGRNKFLGEVLGRRVCCEQHCWWGEKNLYDDMSVSYHHRLHTDFLTVCSMWSCWCISFQVQLCIVFIIYREGKNESVNTRVNNLVFEWVTWYIFQSCPMNCWKVIMSWYRTCMWAPGNLSFIHHLW